MTWIVDIWGKLKTYSLAIAGIAAGLFYVLWKASSKKNAALTAENTSLQESNVSSAKAVKEKERQDRALREANEAINNIDVKYHYSDDNK